MSSGEIVLGLVPIVTPMTFSKSSFRCGSDLWEAVLTKGFTGIPPLRLLQDRTIVP